MVVYWSCDLHSNPVVAAKLFRMWWPETGSNRRRRPFQGRALPLSYLALAWTPVIGDRQEPPCANATSVAPAFQGSPSLAGSQQRKRILSIAIPSDTANSPVSRYPFSSFELQGRPCSVAFKASRL